MPTEKFAASGRQTRLTGWAQYLLRLYPAAWRDRYRIEVAELLGQHSVTPWTLLDILSGAVDARLHPNLLPRRLTTMTQRLRSSEIAIFGAFVLFCLAWLPLTIVRDPLPVWEAAAGAHPELRTMLNLLDLAGLVAILAVLGGGAPILVASLAQAVRARRRRQLLLFSVPPLAVALFALFAIFAIPASGSRVSNTPGAPLSALAVILQLGLVLILLLAAVGSAAAIAAAVSNSEVGEGLLRFGLLTAGAVTVALAVGLVAGISLTALIFLEAPQVSFFLPMHIADLLLMLFAVTLAGFGLRRGIQALR
jgi:hypothetical protein